MMRIQIRLFGEFREAVGQGSVVLELPLGADCLQALRELAARHPRLGPLLFAGENVRDHIHVFLNGQNVNNLDGLATKLADGDVLTFFTPISGG